MLDRELQALIDAERILEGIRKSLTFAPMSVWSFVSDAQAHVNKRIGSFFSEAA
jgi:hypothetical protein